MKTTMNKEVMKALKQTFTQIETNDISSGLSWYRQANRKIREYSHAVDVDPDMFAKVVAILSPANVWERNLSDAYNLVFSHRYEREQLKKLTFTTYKSNVKKAIDLLDGKIDFIMTESNMKTYSFYRNLMLDSEYVTIDRWMLRLIDFEMYFGKSLTSKRYKDYSEYFYVLAKDLKMKPFELQAIFWEYIRNKA